MARVRYMTFFFSFGGGGGSRKAYVILMGGHAKRLLLRGEGGGSKFPKTCLRNTWMFPCVTDMITIFRAFATGVRELKNHLLQETS